MQTQKTTPFVSLAAAVERFAYRLNYVLERLCALLVAAMIGVVWFGIVERYALALGATWTEELARYIMIWAALLAVPCCAYRREHIGLDLVFSRLPLNWQLPARMVLDLLGLCFFLFLAYYGVTMAKSGANQFATIFGMTMFVPFTAVPITAGLTVIQIGAVMIRDAARITPMFARKEAA
ncbi:Tripartite ATP-independent periplasmic transporter DctQ component [Pseudodesulfovibrio mercurii]|uniref:Tripartite ATP-independent periplasmic transporter DctQ component n=1 Tax=Pseudodesulfovibrio mercurii TaxID=641491 RepID=F0JDM4_9BACT|nr:TRAP transporter small permease [Pseudodesulfovibrio mercurii]EGB14556.1 Tripartite ATP-independent periplasmic transporter DctQ component [Pseudodesulfovibrio mercurii]